MKVRVLYFAQVAEKLGISQEEIEIESGSNSEGLIDLLNNKYPELKSLTFKISVDQTLSHSSIGLTENCEVALLPPFAGG